MLLKPTKYSLTVIDMPATQLPSQNFMWYLPKWIVEINVYLLYFIHILYPGHSGGHSPNLFQFVIYIWKWKNINETWRIIIQKSGSCCSSYLKITPVLEDMYVSLKFRKWWEWLIYFRHYLQPFCVKLWLFGLSPQEDEGNLKEACLFWTISTVGRKSFLRSLKQVIDIGLLIVKALPLI